METQTTSVRCPTLAFRPSGTWGQPEEPDVDKRDGDGKDVDSEPRAALAWRDFPKHVALCYFIDLPPQPSERRPRVLMD